MDSRCSCDGSRSSSVSSSSSAAATADIFDFSDDDDVMPRPTPAGDDVSDEESSALEYEIVRDDEEDLSGHPCFRNLPPHLRLVEARQAERARPRALAHTIPSTPQNAGLGNEPPLPAARPLRREVVRIGRRATDGFGGYIVHVESDGARSGGESRSSTGSSVSRPTSAVDDLLLAHALIRAMPALLQLEEARQRQLARREMVRIGRRATDGFGGGVVHMSISEESNESDFEVPDDGSREEEMSADEREQREAEDQRRVTCESTAVLGACTICHEDDVVEPTMCKNCKNIVGCYTCVARWMRAAENPQCPLCRERWPENADRAIAVRLL